MTALGAGRRGAVLILTADTELAPIESVDRGQPRQARNEVGTILVNGACHS